MQGTIARLSARLESSIAKEKFLKQRLYQLQDISSHQQSASRAEAPAPIVDWQPNAAQHLNSKAAAGTSSPLEGDPATQQGVKSDPAAAQLQASSKEQQQQQKPGADSAIHAELDLRSASLKGQDAQQAKIDALEAELRIVKASMPADERETENKVSRR